MPFIHVHNLVDEITRIVYKKRQMDVPHQTDGFFGTRLPPTLGWAQRRHDRHRLGPPESYRNMVEKFPPRVTGYKDRRNMNLIYLHILEGEEVID